MVKSSDSLRVVFRVDASLQIGTGHITRCLTLADMLRSLGGTCRFICRANHGNLIEIVREQGHDVHSLPLDKNWLMPADAGDGQDRGYSSWLGAEWRKDVDQTLAAIGDDKPVEWLIVDHYAVDIRWEHALRQACRRLMVIDDLADRQHDCDLLLDQNLGRQAAEYTDLVPMDCTILTGPKHALLRPEFSELRPYSLSRRARPKFKRLLIAMGGVDEDDVTGRLLEALRRCTFSSDIRITVVMGTHSPWIESVRESARTMPWVTDVLANIHDMASLMAECDVAIGAAGTTAWERCCLGLPTLTIVIAENQRRVAEALRAAGATLLLDEQADIAAELEAKLALLNQPKVLDQMRQVSCSITDGCGANKLAEALLHER